MAKRKGPKKPESAQTKFKRQQAARSRRRNPKGSSLGGRFASGLASGGARQEAINFRKGGNAPKFESARWAGNEGLAPNMEKLSSPYPGATSRELFMQNYQQKMRTLQNKGMSRADAHNEAVSTAAQYAYARTGVMPDINEAGLPPRVTSRDPSSDKSRAERLFAQMDRPEQAPGARPKTTRELYQQLPAKEKAAFEDPQSQLRQQLRQGITTTSTVKGRTYDSPGERDRQAKYIRARAAGASESEAIRAAMEDRRGRRSTVAGGVTREDISQNVRERGNRSGRRNKYESMAPRAGEFSFGVRAPKVSSTNALEKRFPGLSENDYVRIQQAERETIFDEFLRNQAWAHETRQAKLLGSNRMEGPDKVTFFTTSFGYPNVSVPADSLVGQYVIRRRKDMLKKEGIARGSQLRGRFPEAVRDMHVVEFTTGTSLGIEGTAGLMHKTGWRARGRRSKGYGKPVPVGSTVLRDSTGAPIYDSEGNLRYTEGATRRFRIGTPRELGLGIYIG